VNLPQEVGEPDQYGVVGHPVEHSWSPFIHGMFAKVAAQNLVYRLFDIHPDDFRRETLRLMTGGVRGLNVTLPHKQAAAELVNELTPRAARAQAVNTIAFFENTTLLGDNTDGVGLITDLEQNLQIDLADKRVLILGAGGAARGAAPAILARGPAQLTIANRDLGKARQLVETFARFGPIEAMSYAYLSTQNRYDLVLNSTSASWSGETPPAPSACFAPGALAYDLVYGKGLTPFLALARDAGSGRLADGVGMLVEQAAEAFAWWRGVRPSTNAVIAALSIPLV